MWSLFRRVLMNSEGSIPVYLGLISFGLIALGLAAAFVSSSRLEYSGSVAQAPPHQSKGGPKDSGQIEKEQQERQRLASWEEISPHHWRVVGWVLECSNIKEVPKLPQYLRAFFDPRQADPTPLKEPIAPPARLPHHHEMALVQLSHAIADHRQVLSTKVHATYRDAQIASFASVVLGFITTLVVSLISTAFGQGQGRIQHWMRFMAIALTALGTATSAVIAFYGPLDEWNGTKRTLAALTSLHNVVGLETWKLDCLEFQGGEFKPDSERNKLVMQRFEEWTKRYYELQTVSGSIPTEKPPGSAKSTTKDNH